ncbi:polysaccharide deacetylase family protein [Chitinophaga sp. CF418]|uniref:polysaccharide deacetylase family protein n=1 Tax=Chitinophaga sp. CF418 TaxID=1855287 RepID=UPI00091F2DD0|nr:polysaccharide deacetylase family protein [Chitinophaga sp. CF418]SHM13941.1 Polysaccharide deacetylase [Chitinophaga sp. CF418]
MSKKCTIIMYHYVRDLKHTRYPEIKGLDLSLFYEQITYLEKNYSIIKMEQLIDAIDNDAELPPNACLLTFDDGYIDHYTNVFPFLEKKKLQGSFFLPVKTALENEILDVNKIHFILANVANKELIVQEIFQQLNEYRETYNLQSDEFYFKKLAVANRYDSESIIFIKRMLQVELPEIVRNAITDALFRKFVSADEKAFSRELYMGIEQVECMQRNGMHIGGHGNNHYWLGSLSKELQRIELTESVKLVEKIGGNLDYWTMCYPYGNYNNDTIDLLKELKCKAALTTEVDIAKVSDARRFELARLDTNDIPKNGNAQVNDWFGKS